MPADLDKLISKAQAANQEVAETKAAYLKATEARTEAIVSAVDGGVSLSRMARALNLTVPRIRQILDKARNGAGR